MSRSSTTNVLTSRALGLPPEERSEPVGTGRPTRGLLSAVSDLQDFLEPETLTLPNIVARSPVMLKLLDQARRFAASKASVLVVGESGTGKELITRFIHMSSPRSRFPYVCVNCAALSENLIESEMFGHERGAYTGAVETHQGRFERAHRGTLLLDEISEISPKLQAKLLRVLEEEEIERVGGRKPISIDVRVLATSNRELRKEVALGQFRQDLLYRLNVVQIRVPALRERPQDIAPLAAHFLAQFRDESPAATTGISKRALELLQKHSWPGNVREFRNVMQHACLLAKGSEVQPEDLPSLDVLEPGEMAPRTLEQIERDAILSTLRELGGNKTEAARRLGVTPRTLLNKMNRYRQEGAL
jgi:transcriptional regulator with PAS, ATPase and Fis domain